jgi:hypothetical protein
MSYQPQMRLSANGRPVEAANPLPVTSLPPATATSGTAAAVAAVNAAHDLVETYTYLSAGTADQRVETITRSSASLGLSYVTTYGYAGSPGSFRVATITRS